MYDQAARLPPLILSFAGLRTDAAPATDADASPHSDGSSSEDGSGSGSGYPTTVEVRSCGTLLQ